MNLQEFNFRNLVEPFLRDIQGRRGITDFSVVADGTNNTGEVIDRNEFVADIFIKPARSINFIQQLCCSPNWCCIFRDRGIRSMSQNINTFRSKLTGGGARANQFKIQFNNVLELWVVLD